MDDLTSRACVLATDLSGLLVGVDPALAVSALLILTRAMYQDGVQSPIPADVLFFLEDIDIQRERASCTFARVR